MSKLNEIMFKPIQSKEFELMGKKIVLKALNTKDTIELDLEVREGFTTSELLKFAVKVLSRAIVSIEGIVPDNFEETKQYLETQDSNVVLDMLGEYQEFNNVTKEEIKN